MGPISPSEPACDETPAKDVTGASGVDDRHPKTGRVNLRSTYQRQAPLLTECRTDQSRLESSRQGRQGRADTGDTGEGLGNVRAVIIRSI